MGDDKAIDDLSDAIKLPQPALRERLEARLHDLPGRATAQAARGTPDVREYPLPTDIHVREDYRVFPLELEDDPFVVFHGTARSNVQAIIEEGFKRGSDVGATLESISYAKGSSAALGHWVNRREQGQDGVILALRFGSFVGLSEEAQTVYDYKEVPTQPEVVGCVVVPGTYIHR
ncbi:hypothetical protein [Mesorhizobium sp. M0323]|uniref:hypothetical protein n=1 Tax=Mesorhizobium sp. M0323 TaxID=2956938 RepID=UPI003335A0D7